MFLSALFWLNSTTAQNDSLEKNLHYVPSVIFDDESVTEKTSSLEFPNLFKPGFYYDKKQFKRIKKAEKSKDYEYLLELLTEYVRNFKIENFRKQSDYLWKLGLLEESVAKDTNLALEYFKLAIKNTSRYDNKVLQHYDSLKYDTKSDWVDLGFYYKLIEVKSRVDTLKPDLGIIMNMGEKVNSEFPDYAPVMHPSNQVMIFTSRRGDNALIGGANYTQNEDLYYIEKNIFTKKWNNAVKFSDEINSQFNEGSACLSEDGQTLFFTRCNAPDGMGICDIYTAEYYKGKWVNVQNLGPNVNSEMWDSHPNITPDGKILFFSSNRDGGFGKCDLYMCKKLADGSWTKAKNLGPIINTNEDELTPFYVNINQTLYFSSAGHVLNFGHYDIFKTRWLNHNWEEPKNLGPLINSGGAEHYFSIDGKGEIIFYSVAQYSKPNDFDLYSFTLPMEARPDAITKLSGYLIDTASGKPIHGVVTVKDLEDGIEIIPKIINPKTGYFEFYLVPGKKYELTIHSTNIFKIKKTFVLEKDTSFKIFTSPIRKRKSIVFENVQFEESSFLLSLDAKKSIKYLTQFMLEHPNFLLNIHGHTDSDGDAKKNQELSYNRALEIKKFIAQSGINPNRVQAIGHGEDVPIVPNDTEENKKINRRVEFELILDPKFSGTALNKPFLNKILEALPKDTSKANDNDIWADFDMENLVFSQTTGLETEAIDYEEDLDDLELLADDDMDFEALTDLEELDDSDNLGDLDLDNENIEEDFEDSFDDFQLPLLDENELESMTELELDEGFEELAGEDFEMESITDENFEDFNVDLDFNEEFGQEDWEMTFENMFLDNLDLELQNLDIEELDEDSESDFDEIDNFDDLTVDEDFSDLGDVELSGIDQIDDTNDVLDEFNLNDDPEIAGDLDDENTDMFEDFDFDEDMDFLDEDLTDDLDFDTEDDDFLDGIDNLDLDLDDELGF